MPEYCTCGAKLPEDAVFCHKCGKPQRDIAPVEPEAPPPPPPQHIVVSEPAPAKSVDVTLGNPDVWKVAAQTAVLATLLFFLFFVTWVAAGFLAVYLFHRRTRRPMNVAACLRLGWVTGLLTFAIPAIFFTLWLVVVNGPGGMDAFRAMMQSVKDPEVQKTFQAVWNTIQSTPKLLGAYLQYFISTTFFSMAGGLLGSLLVRPVNPPRQGGNIV